MDLDTINITATVPTTATTTSATTRATDNPALLPLRTLIVDNYDSYTFNLLQLFDEDQLKNVVVIRNDQFQWYVLFRITHTIPIHASEIGQFPVVCFPLHLPIAMISHPYVVHTFLSRPVFKQEILPYFDQIILSPGPGRPERTQVLQSVKTFFRPTFDPTI